MVNYNNLIGKTYFNYVLLSANVVNDCIDISETSWHYNHTFTFLNKRTNKIIITNFLSAKDTCDKLVFFNRKKEIFVIDKDYTDKNSYFSAYIIEE